MKHTPRVAVSYPETLPWMAETLRGIKDFADQHGGWIIITSPPSLQSTGEKTIHIPSLRRWKGDGIITVITSQQEEKQASKLPVPVVNLSGWHAPSPRSLPRVNADHWKMGRLAADHFMSKGIMNMAYYGFEKLWFSMERSRGLRERAVEMAFTFDQFLHPINPPPASWQQQRRDLRTWLRLLPKPVGILCVHDYRARIVLELCEELHLRVPEEVAVLGVDNDQMTCDYCTPSLSSISRDPFSCGLAAAELLHHLMLKQPVKDSCVLVPPGGIIQRQSTTRLYDSDPIIRGALLYIQNNIGTPFTTLTLADHLRLSRRTLETRFQSKLGITPHAYVLQQRIAYAKALMQRTDSYQTIREIAFASGFNTVKAFRLAFKEATALNPAYYRKRLD